MPDRTSSTMPATAGPVSLQLVSVARSLDRSQRRLVPLCADFDDTGEWALAGFPTASHWLAELFGVAVATARSWVRIGHQLREHQELARAFADGELSYTKVRTLAGVIDEANESDLVDLARRVPAGQLPRAVAAQLARESDLDELEAHQRRQRSVRWRTDPDGMVTFTLRLPPLVAATLIAWLSRWLMTRRPRTATQRGNGEPAGSPMPPSVAQQHADAFAELLEGGGIASTTEVVLHVRGDGCTLDDGTPVSESEVASLVPSSFISALIHDSEGRPIDATNRRRFPTRRQKRLVVERDRVCVDCGREDLLEYDHDPPFEETGHTVTDELHLRCALCHRERHGHRARHAKAARADHYPVGA